MKIHDVEQRSVDWALLRSGIPTASEFDALITPLGKIRTGDTPSTYLAKKLAEKWQGGPLAGFNTFDMDMGNMLEDEALPWFEFEHKKEVRRVGFITSDDGLVGCSPDGLIDDGGIEIKCPAVHTHVGYLLDGILPPEYVAQVQGSMYVTGSQWWNFLSYCRHFPPLLIRVERDEKFQDNLHEALALFLNRLEQGFELLKERHGGPPRRTHYTPTERVVRPAVQVNIDEVIP